MAIGKDFGFVGRLCLDFAQTGDMGYGARFERLTRPSELRRWLSLSPLGLPPVRVTRAELRSATALRGAIWRVAEAVLGGTRPAYADIRRLNRVGRDAPLVRELSRAADSLRWSHPTTAAALATIARDAIVLFGEAGERSRLRRCENTGCIVIFYDDSRPGLRRWCASNRCGDRVRARLYRARRRQRSG
jgi:predicted RNA-binding Zn ribbon-like protein